MIARISSGLHGGLLALAAAEPGREVCGLLLGEARSGEDKSGKDAGSPNSGRAGPVDALPLRSSSEDRRAALRQHQGERIIELLRAANIADDPARRFEIDPSALIAAHRAERAGGPRLIGHYHSHPSGPAAPSPCDAAQAHEAGRLWLIVGEGRVTAWRAVPGGSVHGAFEAVTLRVEPDGCETGHTSPQGAA